MTDITADTAITDAPLERAPKRAFALKLSKKTVTVAVAGVVAVALAIGGSAWWMSAQRWQGTENAYVQADTVTVMPQVTGYVSEVLVSDNQTVQAGQVLVKIDPADAQAAVAQAQANVAAAEAAVQNVDDRSALAQSQIAQQAAGVKSAQAQASLAQADLGRYSKLASQGWVAPQRLQTARAGADQAAAGVAQADAALEAQRKQAASLGSSREQALAQVQQAKAALQQAQINLDRTVIRAPVAGVIGARGVRPGQYVRPGGALLSVVPLGQTFVVANFKETQVARMRIGQAVEIKADAFPGRRIIGHVDSFAPATGSEFALIPVENATGNFTKIVQRVPVRIAVDSRDPLAAALRPGLSVEAKVDLKSGARGATFAEAAALTGSPRYALNTQNR
ncbi:MAG: HlyD family secretion protein [Proteobacteria bacterium]|nr:HlyD family secretion protein [Pseudomonadota bacterium]